MSANDGISHVTKAGSNVFADLGFSDREAETLRIKSEMMIAVTQWVREEHLKQAEAAVRLGISRPRVSDVMTGKSHKFTIDALVDMLDRAGKKVEVSISSASSAA